MKKEKTYLDSVHFTGRIWMVSAVLLLLSIPAAICLKYGVWPQGSVFLKGFLGVAPIYWTVAIIEVFTYAPMLGAGGSYLGFVTGSLSNLKVPCTLNAMESAKVKPGTEEGEVVSTIAIATSSIVTTLVIAIGILLLVPLQPILESPVLAPAFANILPALFGALTVAVVSREWKIAVLPIFVMLLIFLFVPAIASSVGILVPVAVLITLGSSRFMYQKGILK